MGRENVVTEALTWKGTPYHGHARLKGIGVDCANMPAAVYHACGLIPDLRPVYDEQWHIHRDAELYLEWVRPHADEIDVVDAKPGDFLIWKFGRTYSHGGIVISGTDIIHAYVGIGVVVTNWRQHSELNNRPVKAFTLWPENERG